VGNTNEIEDLDLGNGSKVFSFSEDESKFVDFFGIRGRENSSWGGDLEGTAHGVESNTYFRGTFFPGEVGLSEEEVISKVKLVSVVESVEVFKKFFVVFRLDFDSVE